MHPGRAVGVGADQSHLGEPESSLRSALRPGFFDNSWFAGFDQAETLAAITCPTTFLKATTRYNKDGILLAALSDEDLARVEELLPDNRTVRVRGGHDIHFAHTKAYVNALIGLARRLPSVQKAG